jgi:hypothetical protein
MTHQAAARAFDFEDVAYAPASRGARDQILANGHVTRVAEAAHLEQAIGTASWERRGWLGRLRRKSANLRAM